jgi:hypothetical protein
MGPFQWERAAMGMIQAIPTAAGSVCPLRLRVRIRYLVMHGVRCGTGAKMPRARRRRRSVKGFDWFRERADHARKCEHNPDEVSNRVEDEVSARSVPTATATATATAADF